MSDQIRRVEYRYVEVDDKPGAAARVFGALEQQGVSLLSMTAFPKSAGKASLKLSPKKQAIFVSGQDRPGAVAAIFKKLGEARINVIAANAACGQSGSGFGLILWVKPSDLDAAAKALGV
jgi:predicted amino acid-binding ACT domain protein